MKPSQEVLDNRIHRRNVMEARGSRDMRAHPRGTVTYGSCGAKEHAEINKTKESRQYKLSPKFPGELFCDKCSNYIDKHGVKRPQELVDRKPVTDKPANGICENPHCKDRIHGYSGKRGLWLCLSCKRTTRKDLPDAKDIAL